MFTYYKLVVAGGREFSDYDLLAEKLDNIRYVVWDQDIADDVEIVCGKARGADTLGETWAKKNHVGVKYFPANWNRQSDGSYDKAAGYKRNHQMAEYADALIAFWDGESKGTAHMINLATEKDLTVMVVRY
jgi:hypothetical protein